MRLESPLRAGRAVEAGALREIRQTMELRHFKWDAQVGDTEVLSPTPLLIGSVGWRELAGLSEQLFAETVAAEQEILARPRLQRRVGLPRALERLFARGVSSPAAARVMRFDFHWTSEGWRVSEVNADVPGGYCEASHFTALIAEHVPGARPAGDPTAALVDAVAQSAGEGALVALTSAAGHMEDHQVVAYLASAMKRAGLASQVVSLPQLSWSDGRALLSSGANAGRAVAAIVRFYQIEWLARLPRSSGFQWLFAGGRTPLVNPGVAGLCESKRFPLVWDDLSVPLCTWRRLLPETRALGDAPYATDDGWLIKSSYCNTGDTVSMRSAMTAREWAGRVFRARLNPSAWVAQRRFVTEPVFDEQGAVFPCIGVYVVDGRAAGAYARMTRGPVIDFAAWDAALLIYDEA
jgi:glutathionylspermidine synthase